MAAVEVVAAVRQLAAVVVVVELPLEEVRLPEQALVARRLQRLQYPLYLPQPTPHLRAPQRPLALAAAVKCRARMLSCPI